MTEEYDNIANKCMVTNKKTLEKLKELLKILRTKKSIVCSESCKVAVCLQLAANVTNLIELDQKEVIKYSGCKKSVYNKHFNLIAKILNLDQIYTVKEVCLTVNASELQGAAEKILDNYKKTQNLSKEDLEHPMYPCAAVLVTAKCRKVSVDTKKIVELSRIKKRELDELTSRMESDSKEILSGKKRSRDGNLVGNLVLSNDVDSSKMKPKKTADDEEEKYLEWKKRMLSES